MRESSWQPAALSGWRWAHHRGHPRRHPHRSGSTCGAPPRYLRVGHPTKSISRGERIQGFGGGGQFSNGKSATLLIDCCCNDPLIPRTSSLQSIYPFALWFLSPWGLPAGRTRKFFSKGWWMVLYQELSVFADVYRPRSEMMDRYLAPAHKLKRSIPDLIPRPWLLRHWLPHISISIPGRARWRWVTSSYCAVGI